MLRIYYTIWIDGLLKLRSIPKNRTMWKFYGYAFISMAMALNIALIMAIFQRNIMHKTFCQVNVDIFPGTKIDAFINFFILYMILPLVVNYLLIFRGNRYEKLFKQYKYHNGKLCVSYLMVSYFLPFLLLFIGHLIENK